MKLEKILTFNLTESPCGKGALDIPKYLRLASELDPEMPMIIEHLGTEEEYVLAVEYVKSLNLK